MKVVHVLAALGLAAASFVTNANTRPGPTEFDRCFEQAGATYSISPFLLKAIARQESTMNPRAIGRNPNPAMADEYGIGIMQISSWWLPRLAKIGVTERQLLESACTNITVGAWILAGNIERHGMTWTAVGAYNAKTDWKRQAYAKKIQRHLIAELRAAGVPLKSGTIQ